MVAILRLSMALFTIHWAAGWAQGAAPKSPPTLNVTGKWEASMGGFYGQMRQTGNLIFGRCKHDCAYEGQCDRPGISQCYVRGAQLGDHVVLTAFTTNSDTSEPCSRLTLIAANVGKLSPLTVRKYGEETGQDGITRTSADGGAWASFPYDMELERCGDVVTYELSFDVSSAVIKNPDAAVLSAMAALLKAKPSAKLRIVGHTDATGSGETNKKLSLERAAAVKARIVELCGCDASRLQADGMGPDQPLESNDTADGRALNRRVEITLGH